MKGIVYDKNLTVIYVIDNPRKDGNRIIGDGGTIYIGDKLRYAKVVSTDLKEGDILPAPLFPASEDVDKETEAEINATIHDTAPIGEQIGILRAQIGAILNEIGLEPNPDFDQLNNIAAEKIQEGQKKKEAL